MITPKGIKKVVYENDRYIDIPNRAAMDSMVYFVADLLKEAGDKETADKVREFYYSLEDMSSSEIAREEIWTE